VIEDQMNHDPSDYERKSDYPDAVALDIWQGKTRVAAVIELKHP
jgi:hypothetical protein